jgi:membrane-associated phospholipid phosphatase
VGFRPFGTPAPVQGHPGRYRGESCSKSGTTLLMHAMTTALDPAPPASGSDGGPRPTPVPRPEGVPLWVACVLLGAVVVGGAVLRFEPGRNVLDSWGFSVFPNVLQNEFLRLMSDLGRAPVTAGVSLVAGALVWRRDRRRTIACLAGPGLAVAMAELLKIIVGRRFEGALCWPSGTTAAVAAVAAVVVLVLRGKARGVAAVVGSTVVLFEAVALVSFRWHYLTDVLGGIVLGVGCVLLADAVFHRLSLPPRLRARWRRPPAPSSPLF